MPQDRKSTPELEGVVLASELVAFQPGAVVSRTVVQKAAGTVTVFAFGAGEGLSEHTAPFDALVLGLEGEADISISGAPHRVGPGGLLKLPAGQPHAIAAMSPFKMLLVMIRA